MKNAQDICRMSKLVVFAFSIHSLEMQSVEMLIVSSVLQGFS